MVIIIIVILCVSLYVYLNKNKKDLTEDKKKTILKYMLIFVIASVLVMGIIKGIIGAGENNNLGVLNSAKTEINNKKIYKSFDKDIVSTKNFVDSMFEDLEIGKNIKSKDWQYFKQTVEPHLDMTIKEFYVEKNKEFGLLSFAINESGNIVDVRFSSIPTFNYGEDVLFEYYKIIFALPHILYYFTDDENLKKEFSQILADCYDSGEWYCNEIKQGIAFNIGNDKNGYFNIEMCLEEYTN